MFTVYNTRDAAIELSSEEKDSSEKGYRGMEEEGDGKQNRHIQEDKKIGGKGAIGTQY